MNFKHLILAISLSLTVGLVSCTEGETPSPTTTSEASSEASLFKEGSAADLSELSSIQIQIDSVNEALPNAPVSGQSRGFLNFCKRILAIAISDAVGATSGNYTSSVDRLVNAITASAVAAFLPDDQLSLNPYSRSLPTPNERMRINPDDIALSKKIIPTPIPGSQLSKEDSIGYLHNLVLINLNKSLTDNELTVSVIENKVADATSTIYSLPKDSISNILTQQHLFFESIITKRLYAASETDNIHTIVANWKSVYPNQSNQLDVIESFFNGISTLEVSENDGTYLNQVLDIIEASSLSPEMKLNIRNAFIVGNASYQLWNTGE